MIFPSKNRQLMDEASTKHRILLAAGPIFAAKGFEATTVRDICDQASVNVASVNYYFGDKNQLYLETVREARCRRAEAFPFDPAEQSSDPEIQLRAYVGTLLNRLVALQTAPWEVQLLMREVLKPTDACRHLIEEYFRPFFEVLLGIIEKIHGESLAAHQIRQIGYSVIGQCLFYRYSAEMIQLTISANEFTANYDIEQLTDHITRFCLAGIKQYSHPPAESPNSSGK